MAPKMFAALVVLGSLASVAFATQPTIDAIAGFTTYNTETVSYGSNTSPTITWETAAPADVCYCRLRANKLGFSADGPGAYTAGMLMGQTAADGAVVDSELEPYGFDFQSCTVSAGGCSAADNCAYTPATTLPDGYYSFAVVCDVTNVAGLANNPVAYTHFKIDTVKPVTTLVVKAGVNDYDPSRSDYAPGTPYIFTVSGVDYYGGDFYTATTTTKAGCAGTTDCELMNTKFECKLNNGDWSTCAGFAAADVASSTALGGVTNFDHTISNPGTGQHTLQVRAVDAAGNTEAYPAFYSWSVETYTRTTACTYAYDLDGAGYVSTGSSGANAYKVLSGLSDGAHTFTVKAFDIYLNPTATASLNAFSWTVDTTAPSSTLSTTWASQAAPSVTSAVYSWSFSEAGSYSRYSTDGSSFVLASGKTDTSVTLPTGTFPIGSRSFKVYGIDILGNVGSSVTDSFTVEPIDTALTCTGCVSCTASVTAPISSSTVVFTIGATVDTDTSPTFTYEYALGDGKYKAGQHYPNFGIKGFSDGDYTLKARAYTSSGSVDPSPAEVCFKVDLTAPVVQIMSGPAAVSSDANPVVSGAVADANVNSAGAQYRLVKVGVYDSGYTTLGNPVVDSATGTFSIPLVNLTDGHYTIYIKATDLAGNVGEAAMHSWFVDFGPPDTSFDAGPATPTPVEDEYVFVLSCSETPCTFEYKVDSADAWTAADDSTVAVKDVPMGVHTMEVRAYDVAGNVDPTPAAYSWTVYGEEMYAAFGKNAGFAATGVAPGAYTPPSFDKVQVE